MNGKNVSVLLLRDDEIIGDYYINVVESVDILK